MKITKEGEEITLRFFESLEFLKHDGKIRGIKTFTRKHNINYWNILTLKKEPSKRFLKCEYLAYLVEDYGISADWLLTGRGNILLKSD